MWLRLTSIIHFLSQPDRRLSVGCFYNLSIVAANRTNKVNTAGRRFPECYLTHIASNHTNLAHTDYCTVIFLFSLKGRLYAVQFSTARDKKITIVRETCWYLWSKTGIPCCSAGQVPRWNPSRDPRQLTSQSKRWVEHWNDSRTWWAVVLLRFVAKFVRSLLFSLFQLVVNL